MIDSTEQHVPHDPLLDCLVIFAKRYHRAVSPEALVAGLPVEPGHSSPELFSLETSKAMFSRVASRAGLAARLVERELGNISGLLLPCILVMKSRGACILEQVDRDKQQAKVILPDIGEGETWVDLDMIEQDYLGYAFLLKPEYQGQTGQTRLLNVRAGHWFWGTIRQSWEMYAAVIIGTVMTNLFALATPLFTMNVYDRVVPNEAVDTLWVLAVGMGVVFIFDALMKLIRTYLIEMAGKKSDVIMSSVLYEQAMGLRLENWPKSVGEFANTFQQFESVRTFFASTTIVALVDLPFTLVFLIVISYIGDALVAVPFITMALVLAFTLVINQPLRASVRRSYEATSRKHSLLVESLSSIQTLKTLGAERYSQWAWEEATGQIAALSHRTRQLSSSISTVTGLLSQFNMVLIVFLGVHEIISLELTMGGLIAAVALSSRAIAPIGQVAVLVTQYQQTKAAYNSLNALMAAETERNDGQSYIRRPEFEGELKFENVSFSYPEAESPSLSEFTLTVKPGEHVGIIGRVGSGKTTLAKLILALYRPTGGTILLDGLDLNQIDPADLRRNIGYLSQEIELVRGTIRENITLKDPSVDDETLLKAAYIAGVDTFVNRLPRGYDTALGETGSGLSGGQRQSVALARTLLLGEKLVILDEPTNSMDNSTESVIRNRLFEYTRDKTLILITHKAPMLKLVERLVVVEAGKILVDGPRREVLKFLKESGGPEMREG